MIGLRANAVGNNMNLSVRRSEENFDSKDGDPHTCVVEIEFVFGRTALDVERKVFFAYHG